MSRLTLILGLISLALLAVSALVGTAPVSLSDSLAALAGQGDAATQTILWEIRLPRAAAAFAVGAALGLAGAGLQGLLQNPLAKSSGRQTSRTSGDPGSTGRKASVTRWVHPAPW